MTAAAVRRYPWHALAATTGVEVAALGSVRRVARDLVRLDAIADALGALVDARVTVRVRRVVHATAASAEVMADGVCVLLARADDADPVRGILVEAEPALAAALVARVLKRAPPAVVDPARVGSAALAGAWGAVLVAAARSAHAGAPLKILYAGQARAQAYALGAELLVATLTVVVGDDAFAARAFFLASRAMLAHPSSHDGWSENALAALGDLPLSLAIVACSSSASASDIAALAVGDAWMPGGWRLGRPGALSGPVSIASPLSEHGLMADLGEGARVVVGGGRVALRWDDGGSAEPARSPPAEGTTMNDHDKTTERGALADAMGDVPVVVRVEIGTVQMRAREWAALGHGDVVTTGQKIANPVVLRVGGVEVARGELVEIDGEVGVRILSRSEAGA